MVDYPRASPRESEGLSIYPSLSLSLSNEPRLARRAETRRVRYLSYVISCKSALSRPFVVARRLLSPFTREARINRNPRERRRRRMTSGRGGGGGGGGRGAMPGVRNQQARSNEN